MQVCILKHVSKYASMQLFKYARMQVCKYASMQVCKSISLPHSLPLSLILFYFASMYDLLYLLFIKKNLKFQPCNPEKIRTRVHY